MKIRNGCRKIIFCSVDGVLAAPGFGKSGIPYEDEARLKYFIKNGNESMSRCLPVPFMKRFLEKEREDAEIFVLETAETSFEANAKRRFVKENYPDIDTENFIFVAADSQKIPVILEIANENGFFSGECELISDDRKLLAEASKSVIRAHHIADIAVQE